MTNDEGVINLSEVLEVMSPQVRVERMGPAMVEDLPRYHSLVERIDEVTNCWRSTGHLVGVMDMVIFRTIFFELFSFLHVHAPYSPFRLLTNLRNTPRQDQTL